jgi:hypothetical protein
LVVALRHLGGVDAERAEREHRRATTRRALRCRAVRCIRRRGAVDERHHRRSLRGCAIDQGHRCIQTWLRTWGGSRGIIAARQSLRVDHQRASLGCARTNHDDA